MEKNFGIFAFRGRLLLSLFIMSMSIFVGCSAEKANGAIAGDANAKEGNAEETNTETVREERQETEGGNTDTATATEDSAGDNMQGNNGETKDTPQSDAESGGKTGIAGETAEDTVVDIKALQEENPDIFAWLHIPGTDIDCPVLQSTQADDYYESHNAYGETDEEGAAYTELANLTDMCDFNTVLHGKTSGDGKSGLFAGLYQFADPDFFDKHKTAYLYLDGNLLTYEIFAAYEREDNSLLRTYDFTYISGCQEFLDDFYNTRVMGMNVREGWEDLTPYHFLITFTTKRGDNPDRQFVVLGGLVNDAAGTIDRVMYE